MTPKNPTILPGKTLGPEHLSLKEANICPTVIIETEITALLNHAESRLWIPKNSSKTLLEAAKQKNPLLLWEKAKGWHNRFRTDTPEESPAIAGWLLLQNLAQCQTIRESHKAPYAHLLLHSDITESLTALNRFLYYNAYGTKQQQETGQRDLYAIMLLKHLSPREIEQVAIECHKGNTFLNTAYPSWVKAAYGFPTKTNEWKPAPMDTIRKHLTFLLKKESTQTLQWIKTLNIL
jgi:hypothetical protein